MKKLFRTIYILPVLLFLTLGLNGCGGGGGGGSTTPTTSQGKFIDAPAEGITYTSGSTTGETTADGTFTYETGKTVTFSIGGVILGTASGRSIITPVQLVSGAADETDSTVVNIVQFLLTIDDNDDASDGIQISAAIRTAAAGITLDFTSATFDSDKSVTDALVALTTASTFGLRGLVSESFSMSHLRNSLFSIFAGKYSGTFSGTDSGTWIVDIASNGVVTGSGSGTGGAFGVTGNVKTSGSLTASGGAGTSNWTGSIDLGSGNFNGNWIVPGSGVPAEGGTFTGSKI